MVAQKAARRILADNLRKLRESANISQEEFAELCGLHRTYISDIERGNRNVSIDNIERIARVFYISVSELLKESE